MACVASTACFAPPRQRISRSASSRKHVPSGARCVVRTVIVANARGDDKATPEMIPETTNTRRETLVSAIATAVFTGSVPLSIPGPAVAETNGKKIILVVGATGATGRLVVDELRNRGDPDSQIVAAVRSAEKAKKLGVNKGDVSLLPNFDITSDASILAEQMTNVDVAVVCTGFVPGNPFKMAAAAHAVDNEGVVHLVEAAKAAGVKRVVLISSILTDGRTMHAEDSPGFKITNAFGGVLDEKLVGERHLVDSGVEYTIVRPAGLRGEPPKSTLLISPGNVMSSGEVSRELVAKVMAEAAFAPKAAGKIVELAETGTFAAGYEPENVQQYLVGDDKTKWFK